VCYRTDGFLPVIALLKRTVRAINGKLMRGGNRDRSARGNFLFCDEVARAIREEEKPTCEKEKKDQSHGIRAFIWGEVGKSDIPHFCQIFRNAAFPCLQYILLVKRRFIRYGRTARDRCSMNSNTLRIPSRRLF